MDDGMDDGMDDEMRALPAAAYSTERLLLRPLRAEHAPQLFPLLADSRLYTYVPDSARESVALLAARFDELARGAPPGADEVWLNWVILRKDTLEAVGTLQATVEPGAIGWIGYVLVPSAWGRGFATEGCRWLVGELARHHAVREVCASVDVRNAKSIAVLERVGFERVARVPAEIRGEATTDYRYRLSCTG